MEGGIINNYSWEGVVGHGTREAEARAAQGQDKGRMGGEAFEDVPYETKEDGVKF